MRAAADPFERVADDGVNTHVKPVRHRESSMTVLTGSSGSSHFDAILRAGILLGARIDLK
jgi:hypothetical protein